MKLFIAGFIFNNLCPSFFDLEQYTINSKKSENELV